MKAAPGAARLAVSTGGECRNDDAGPVRDQLEAALHRSLAGPRRIPTAPDAGAHRARQAAQAQPYLALAKRLGAAHRWTEAVAALRQAANLAPDVAAVQFELGRACLLTGAANDAAAALFQAVSLRPSHAEAHFCLGMAFEQQGEITPAIAAYRQVLALAPDRTDAAFRLSTLLVSLGQRDGGAACLLAAAAASRDRVAACLARGAAYGIQEDTAAAEAEFRCAREQDPTNANAWRLSGTALVVAGKIDAACEAFRRALELNPRDVSALGELARVTRITEADRPLLQRVTSRLRGTDLTVRQRMMLHFVLGKGRDELGEYAEAMREFDAANAFRERLFPFDRAACTTETDRIVATFPQDMARDPGLGVASQRPVFILGMPRSGTTLVEQILSSHNAIVAGGERRFWGGRSAGWGRAVATGETVPFLRQAASDYLAELAGVAPDSARVTDKNPYNFQRLGLIRLALPDAFIIHCRRNPVDTCLSIYTNFFSDHIDFASRRSNLVFFYRSYLRLMAFWRAVLPPDRFLELDYEHLIADREAETRRLVEFCKLPWDPACLQPERNGRAVHTVSALQVRQPVYTTSVARWRRYEPWLGELRELIPEAGEMPP